MCQVSTEPYLSYLLTLLSDIARIVFKFLLLVRKVEIANEDEGFISTC